MSSERRAGCAHAPRVPEEPILPYEMGAALAAELPAPAGGAEPLDGRAIWEDNPEAVAAVAAPAVQMGFAPDRAPGEIDAFVAKVQAGRAFAAVIEGCRPSAIVTTAPRPPAPLGPP